MTYRITLFIIIVLLFFGCNEYNQDERLSHISEIVSESPNDALSVLDSIDYLSLSKADKHFYDFLSIKAKDMASITHTSDSDFVRVLNYYSNRSSNKLYPEVLYYGGRVYSDLGDYPNALNYFHQSIDCLSADKNNMDLCNRVYSQTGRLLTSLRLYDEAIPYIESALEYNRQAKDTVSLISNLQLLGGAYLRDENYHLAEEHFRKCMDLCINSSSASQIAKSQMYLAAVKYKQGQIDSALLLIRHTPEKVNPSIRNSALVYASNIYLKAGLHDTAYRYSLELISSPDSIHRQIGYQVLLSSDLRKFINPNTLDQYISDYRDLLETFYDENKNQLAINQQNLYNYQLHEREKIEVQKSNDKLLRWVNAFMFINIVMGIILFLQKNRNKNRIIELQQALGYINKLEQELKSIHNTPVDCREIEPHEIGEDQENTNIQRPITGLICRTEQELREILKNKLMSLYNSSHDNPMISPIILQSEPYQALLDLVNKGKTIHDNDCLWNELERVILKSSPQFKTNLYLLTLGKLTTSDFHTAILIKCGIKPSQMTILLGRSNGAIISRRESLCLKALDEKLGVKVIDGVIRLL